MDTYCELLPQVDCQSAGEFIEALSPLGPYFKDAMPSAPWIFRGQGKDDPLIPSLFRGKNRLRRFTNDDTSTYRQMRKVERDLLVEFFETADRRGLVLPDDSQELRTILEILRSPRGEQFLDSKIPDFMIAERALSLIALAQHYGLPTRLLDWTRSSMIAAYFAAESALSPKEDREASGGDYLVVWAFYFPQMGKQDTQNYAPIRLVTAPTASNANLKAQQGVFTLLNDSISEEQKGSYIPMEVALLNQPLSIQVGEASPDPCRLRKFTLRSGNAEDLLYLLAKLDITPSAVYPGYNRIVDDLKRQKNWKTR